jgi:hypothetical protein
MSREQWVELSENLISMWSKLESRRSKHSQKSTRKPQQRTTAKLDHVLAISTYLKRGSRRTWAVCLGKAERAATVSISLRIACVLTFLRGGDLDAGAAEPASTSEFARLRARGMTLSPTVRPRSSDARSGQAGEKRRYMWFRIGLRIWLLLSRACLRSGTRFVPW